MSNHHNYEQVIEKLPGEERGIPSVNDTRPSAAKRGLIVVVLLLVICAAGGIGYWKYKKNLAKDAQTEIKKDLKITSAVPERTFTEPPTTSASIVPPPLPDAIPTTSSPTNAIGVAPTLPGNLETGNNDFPIQELDKSDSSIMAAGPKLKENDRAHSIQGAHNSNDEETGQKSGGMAELLSATSTPKRKAGMIGNRNFILAKGSFIDCALQTRLDSTIPGMTSCVITRNIYSDNGKVLLVERGSNVSGEYKSNMRQGMARIFILWNRIKTPNGVVINLDSPGTDQLGGAGVPGYIDDHFWQRFGGALMLSLVDDVAQAVISKSGNGANQFNFNSTGDAAQGMAAEALKNTINIPPTLYKNQGEQVGIYIARDLDFSSVYDVAVK